MKGFDGFPPALNGCLYVFCLFSKDSPPEPGRFPRPVDFRASTPQCKVVQVKEETKELLPTDTLEGVESVTVLSSWPSKPSVAIQRLQEAQESPSKATAEAVAQCLQHEDLKVVAKALEALSHMGPYGHDHVGAVAELLAQPQLRGHAASCLSWLEEPGARYAAQVLAVGWLQQVPRARSAFWAMCQADAAATRAAAVSSLVERLRCRELNDREKLGQ